MSKADNCKIDLLDCEAPEDVREVVEMYFPNLPLNQFIDTKLYKAFEDAVKAEADLFNKHEKYVSKNEESGPNYYYCY